VIPAVLGETHFAFMGYSLNFRQTPAKREMEYLRVLGVARKALKSSSYLDLRRSWWAVTRNSRLNCNLKI
jgi:ATP-binding cassette subfamily B protein